MSTADSQPSATATSRDTEAATGDPHGHSSALRALRVAMVTPDYPPDVIGGGGVSCHLLVRHLRERGLVVDVYALTERARQARTRRHQPPSTSPLPVSEPAGSDVRLSAAGGRLGRNLRAFAAVRRRVSDYDLVHVYDASLLPAATLIHCLARPRAPVVMHLNNLQGACFTPELCLKEDCDRHTWLKSIRCAIVDPEPSCELRRLLLVHPMFHIVNRMARLLPLFVAISADLKARYVASGFPAERIVVVPNMLDERLFPPREVERKVGSGDELTILCVGQLDHRKGAQDLVAAYARLPAQLQRRARLTLLGAGKDEQALRELIRQYDIGDRVQVRYCRYDNLPDEYAAADVFVKPACWPEPFGRTCLEALACALPILAADVPSAREILGDGALYYRPFHVDDLAAKLGQLIDSEQLRHDTATRAPDRLARYMPSKVVDRLLELYQTCRTGP